MEKKVFRIPVTWTVYGVYYVRAESLEDAREAVHDVELPKESSYVGGSFQVEDECGEAVGLDGKGWNSGSLTEGIEILEA
jgi:hypothetical protein